MAKEKIVDTQPQSDAEIELAGFRNMYPNAERVEEGNDPTGTIRPRIIRMSRVISNPKDPSVRIAQRRK